MNKKNSNTRVKAKEHKSGAWQDIINSLDDEIIVINRDSRITFANTAALRRHELSKSKLFGRHCYKLSKGALEPCLPPDCQCPAAEVWESGKSTKTIHGYSMEAGNGEERYVEVEASPLKDCQGYVTEVVLMACDITETKRMEKQILEANRNLLALNVIADTVSQSLDLDTILNNALDKVLELMKGNTGGILLLDNTTQTLSYRVYRGLSEEFVNGVAGLKVGEGIAGLAAQQKKPIYVENISEDPRLTRYIVVAEGLRAFASIPLLSKNKVLGVMNIASHGLRRFAQEDVQLLSSVSNQIAVALENAKLYEELQHEDEMQRELLRQIISTQEEERRRIARGLHDEISQALTSLAVNLEAVVKALPLDTEQVKSRLKQLQSIALKTLDETHKVIWELRPTLLDDLGLIAAVKSHLETHLEAAGIKVHLETVGTERRLPAKVETAIFRIVQEAVTNIVRHACADSVSISLEFGDFSIMVHIEDDGKGFDFNEAMTVTKGGRGLGLLSMKERAELWGGVLKIKTHPGRGTQIDLGIPVSWEEVPND